MIWTYLDAGLIILGSLSFCLLFWRMPALPFLVEINHEPEEKEHVSPAVTVIIPARNEEHNLALLLHDLSRQSTKPAEIICVDDQSADRTADVARSFSARLISVEKKPADWTGKSYACQLGSEAAVTDLLLFLDADVRLGKAALLRLLGTYQRQEKTISVQPWHSCEHFYEQFSFIFNLLQFAGNGLGRPKGRQTGLFGPLVLMPKAVYESIGGHESVRSSIIDDVDLGRRLTSLGYDFDLYIADPDISYRMYREGFSALCRGWIKNIAAGAGTVPPRVFSLVFLWLTALISVPFNFVYAVRSTDTYQIAAFGLIYCFYAVMLRICGKRLGNFRLWTSLFYPLVLLIFLLLFLISLVFRMLGLQVSWKGRKIPGRMK